MSEPERWIVVEKWDGPGGFQHYTDRDPIWIKNYRDLLAKEEYLTLSFNRRGILHGLWLEYAASNRAIRERTVTLTRRLGQRVTRADLEALNDAGWITFSASKPLAPRYHNASLEENRRDNPLVPLTGTSESQRPQGRSKHTGGLFDINAAARRIIAGNGWDEDTTEAGIRDQFERLVSSARTNGTLDMDAALEAWRGERARRYQDAA